MSVSAVACALIRSPSGERHKRSVTNDISRPFHAKSHGQDPFSRCVALTACPAPVSNSAWRIPFGQVMRATSARSASPSPKWTIGEAMTCFWTCNPVRSSISPPIPNELMRWSPVAVAARGRSDSQR
jgi:hypothetical protein